MRGAPGAKIVGHATQQADEGTSLSVDAGAPRNNAFVPTKDEEEDAENAKRQAEAEPYEFEAYDFFDEDRPWAVDLEEDQRVRAMQERRVMELRRIARGGESSGVEALSSLREKHHMTVSARRVAQGGDLSGDGFSAQHPPALRLLKEKQREARKKAALERVERARAKAAQAEMDAELAAMSRRSDKMMVAKMKNRGEGGEPEGSGVGGRGRAAGATAGGDARAERRAVHHTTTQSRVDSHMPKKMMLATRAHEHDYIRERRGLHPRPLAQNAHAKVDDHMSARMMRATRAHAHDYVRERGLARK